jgi:DNA-directed RNA polymerase specialized sigma24 family protein
MVTTTPRVRRVPAHDGREPALYEKVADAIRRHRAGDCDALTGLFRLVWPWLQSVARGYGLSPHSAEDVAQATLLALVRHVHTIRTPEAALAWLAVTARREALAVIRADRSIELVADLHAEEAGQPGPETVALEKLRRDLVWRHVAVLPARGQMIMHEIAQAGRPDYAVLSDRTGMPVGSIGPTRQRSLARVRRSLESDQDWRAFA